MHFKKNKIKDMPKESLYDPNGSYTGRCSSPTEIPTQDVDDL